MSPADHVIWNRYINTFPTAFDKASYDVRVGKGQDPGPSYPPNIRQMAIKLTQLRIDVLAQKDLNYSLIEIKFDPGTSAIGQLISYNDHLLVDHPEIQPVTLHLICNRLTEDLIYILQQHNIQFTVI